MCLLCFCKCLLLLTVWYFKCFQSNESFEAKGNTSDTRGLITLCGCKPCSSGRETPGANSGVTMCASLWIGGCQGRSTSDTLVERSQPYLGLRVSEVQLPRCWLGADSRLISTVQAENGIWGW